MRIYTPAGDGPFGVLVFFHGGGWVIGDLDTHDALCRTLANESGCRVIAVDYRLAPEHPYPAALDDCYAATKWVEAEADALDIDRSRIAVGGDSAQGPGREGPPYRFPAADLSGHGQSRRGQFAAEVRGRLPARGRDHGLVHASLPA